MFPNCYIYHKSRNGPHDEITKKNNFRKILFVFISKNVILQEIQTKRLYCAEENRFRSGSINLANVISCSNAINLQYMRFNIIDFCFVVNKVFVKVFRFVLNLNTTFCSVITFVYCIKQAHKYGHF
jgi:hypothetical protein